jgi:hypothetical protein
VQAHACGSTSGSGSFAQRGGASPVVAAPPAPQKIPSAVSSLPGHCTPVNARLSPIIGDSQSGSSVSPTVVAPGESDGDRFVDFVADLDYGFFAAF